MQNMEWCEIIGLVAVWFLGLYLGGDFFEFRRNYHYNDSKKNMGMQ